MSVSKRDSEPPNGEASDDAPKKESGVQPVAKKGPKRRQSRVFAAATVPVRRRRHSRLDVQLPVEVKIDGADDTLASRCVNISLGGMFVLLDPAPAHGTRMRVWVRLPTGDRLLVTGTVRWSTPDGVGLQHELLGARDTYILSEYLASLKAAD